MLTTCKLLIMSFLMMSSSILSPATNPSGGGVMDILQVGRNAVIVNIDRSQLPPELRHETITISLIRNTDKTTLTDSTDTGSLTFYTAGLPTGIYTVSAMVHDLTLDRQEIDL